MEEREAIARIKASRDYRYSHYVYTDDDGKAFDMAIKALEKQIPKKPDIEGDGNDPDGNLVYDTWICPTCGVSYEIDYDKYDYCPSCGQKIDWEAVENDGKINK